MKDMTFSKRMETSENKFCELVDSLFKFKYDETLEVDDILKLINDIHKDNIELIALLKEFEDCINEDAELEDVLQTL